MKYFYYRPHVDKVVYFIHNTFGNILFDYEKQTEGSCLYWNNKSLRGINMTGDFLIDC